ncbi:MAG TPA: GGDEF domain-containing protein [Thermoanaerobaculia bacterium]|nr:GGDEF domain-containing protein [Thermoanaerobaculia bacterium]
MTGPALEHARGAADRSESSVLAQLLDPADPAVLEAAAAGERLVATMRVLFWGAIWTIPALTLVLVDSPPPEIPISLIAASFALLASIGVLRSVGHHDYRTGFAFATSTFDVSLISAVLVVVSLVGRPEVAVNSLVVWPIYLLVILTTTLRLDFRLCLFTGLLTLVEYLGFVIWVTQRFDLTGFEHRLDPGYGTVSWPIQIGRLVLQLVATALATGIIHQSRRLAHVSGTDRLTGLANRALFDERVAMEVARAGRVHSTFSLVFLDIDHFKRFNDQFGHEVGDVALRTLAAVIREQSRAGDTLARWGGEEFALVLPDADQSGAVQQVERIRARLAEIEGSGLPRDAQLTISAGVSEFPADGRDGKSLLLTADRRLLAAKRGGRNRVVAGP